MNIYKECVKLNTINRTYIYKYQGGCLIKYKKQELFTLREHLVLLSVSPQFLVGSVLVIFIVFCALLCCWVSFAFVFVLFHQYSKLPVSLDCQFVIALSVFSNVYQACMKK